MSEKNAILRTVYSATTIGEQREAYDAWASRYDQDIFGLGSRLRFVAGVVFANHVRSDRHPILDAGCGTGLQVEALHLAGYKSFTGIDLSEGMLDVARSKGIYEHLHTMVLGDQLDFQDHVFQATVCIGVLTIGHAPPSTLDELIRVTARHGKIIFSLRTDKKVECQEYVDALTLHEKSGRWRKVFNTPSFKSMPEKEPHILNKIYVYEVC